MSAPGPSLPDLAVVAAVNDDAILSQNLARSPLVAEGRAPLHCFRNAASASQAYNQGLDATDAAIVVFAHQDVFLPAGWEADLARAISAIEASDPDWAVIGGWGVASGDGRHVGHVWSSGIGRRLGGRFVEPVRAECIDEYAIVLRRASGLRFDEALPGFHLYAADIVLQARAAGMASYVADIPAIHNSRPVRGYRGGYAQAWRFMREKWRDLLPVRTLTVPLTWSPLPLWRSQFRLWRSRTARFARAVDPASDPAVLTSELAPPITARP